MNSLELIWGLPASGPLTGHGGAIPGPGIPVHEAAAGRPPGQRQNHPGRGAGAAAPAFISRKRNFH